MNYICDIHNAVIYKDVEKCKLLLQDKNNVSLKTSHNMTPLLYACCGTDNFEIIKLLVESGANVNEIDENGDTPLLTLCRVSCDRDRIIYLIENKADIYAKNNMNNTCLTIASGNENCTEVTLNYLIEKLYNLNPTEFESFLKIENDNGHNLFFTACVAGNLNIMTYLMKYNFDINEKNKFGHTCLMSGFYYLQNTNNKFYTDIKNIIDFVIRNGYNINIVNNHGENILCIVMKGYHNIVQMCDVCMHTYGSINLEQIKQSACENAYITFVYLVEKGAQIKDPCFAVAKYLKFDNIVNFIEQQINI